MTARVIAACLKCVDRRPAVDAFTGDVVHDERSRGVSDADEAALEWALRLGEASGARVVAISAGSQRCDSVLRDALAAGADEARRVDIADDVPSGAVGAAIAAALPSEASIVVCGAWSLDRGSGSVPAFVAADRVAAQALGLVSLSWTTDAILAERRLDGGRRERLQLPTSRAAVLSVEGGSARLRRAPLDRVLATLDAEITVVPSAAVASTRPPLRSTPYRPRARVLPAPGRELDARSRILALTGALVDREPPRVLRLDPAAAADELLAQLEAWGYR
ncbi:MAG TPA: mycofactocin-associated electron transfer flavoprotein beta subunit [Acidimicrobiales bacterium]|nr:mycofactocin-associated electron transfer flavoprotein beta subunit [Acidimicrobiales bacterium]